ncbi:hypothetical protein [Mangrovibacterium diazotrophicum]|uniref:Uncharacterized protein n=1 Tax=Mangrovibacterium diazotrophicum TaxID=1261403 RepID=A0A419W7G3_9BACT|nr:hypothetical protein [Mangrovibacterium diazotrophicum]RKD91404.1 hypothetical protein BC643_1757 [Mangrovibacterium diazotrophicum]
MYWKSILLFLTWPVLIAVSLFLVQYVVKKYNDKLEHVKKKYEE